MFVSKTHESEKFMTRFDIDSCQGQLQIKPISSWDKNVHIHPFEEKIMKIERHDIKECDDKCDDS